MTITLSDSLSPANTGLNTGTSEFKSEASPQFDGPSFGQFMSEMFQLQADKSEATTPGEAGLIEPLGQGIADPFALANPGANGWPLKAVTLGPHLNVITQDNSAPDPQSLEAFARAQGLDEQAVSWLFGNHSGGTTLTSSLESKVEGDVQVLDNIEASGAKSTAFASSPISSLPSTTTNILNSAALGLQSKAIPTNQLPNNTLPGPTNGSAGLLGSALIGAQALWATAEETDVTPQTSASAIAEEALPIQMLRMAPPAAVWMQRGVMNNVLLDNAKAQTQATISTSELDLGADWGGETLQQLLGTEGGVSGSSSTGTHGTAYANFAARWDAQTASRNDMANANGPAQDLPDTHGRSENIQNLADKMGQAVGQRILSEMEKGQWHLKLQLRPATLGHIEVEMRMRSGEFDAIFTAPNATTRDLLQDGMVKLRETLAQMGMDVANIHVGNGQSGQSGGDSTPGTPKGKTSQVEATAPERTAETPRAPSVKDPNDGLDVLV